MAIIDFMRDNWDKIILVITTIATIWQELRRKFFKS